MRIILSLTGGVFALLCLTIGTAYGLYALFLWMLSPPAIIPWVAALLTAVVACLIALLLALLVRGQVSKGLKQRSQLPRNVQGAESLLEDCLSSDVRGTLNRNAKAASLTALVLGVTLGGSREARRTVMQLLRDASRKHSD